MKLLIDCRLQESFPRAHVATAINVDTGAVEATHFGGDPLDAVRWLLHDLFEQRRGFVRDEYIDEVSVQPGMPEECVKRIEADVPRDILFRAEINNGRVSLNPPCRVVINVKCPHCGDANRSEFIGVKLSNNLPVSELDTIAPMESTIHEMQITCKRCNRFFKFAVAGYSQIKMMDEV